MPNVLGERLARFLSQIDDKLKKYDNILDMKKTTSRDDTLLLEQ
jgi:hypothetical protein